MNFEDANEVKAVTENVPTPSTGGEVAEKTPVTETSSSEVSAVKPAITSFTQEQVNEIMRERVERTRRSLLNRYGVQSRDELDGLIGKAQSYQIIKERYEEQGFQIKELNRKLAFVNNNINPKREDDIMAYFKGKGLEFNEEVLRNELITHPEWLNVVKNDASPKTTIKTLGIDRTASATPESEDERIKRIFGLQ